MKKIFSLVVLLTIFSTTMLAKQVDEATARQVGQAFLSRSTKVIRTPAKAPLNLVYKSTPSSRMKLAMAPQTKLFYVFNSGTKGFIIIAGDDKVTPILGYSDEGSFNPDSIPENMQAWLEGYKEQISYAIKNNIEATDEIEKEWSELLNPTTPNLMARANTPVVGPLLTTQWDQSPYVNDWCPFDNTQNRRTVTGCVATAMAQIMKYWNHPAIGTGSHSYTHETYGTLSADFGSTNYRWASMPDKVNSKNNAVATLMYHCGVSVDMNYGPNSSGAYQSNVANALKNYFGYSNSVSSKERSSYTDAQWVALLKSELNASRPIQYGGTKAVESVGHSFVCDGYDSNGLFHINWGWGGSSDGYFQIDALNPKSQGTGGSSGGYNFQQEVIIGIQPSTSGTPISATATTGDATDITSTSAILSCTAIPGTDIISEKGFRWKNVDGGTYTDLVSTSPGNNFTAKLTGLTGNTNYVFIAYVKVGSTKIYGLMNGFTTTRTPNMDRYIELTVTPGESIRLDFAADADDTPIEVVSGTYVKPLIVGTSGLSYQKYYAGAATMRIYGNIKRFNCCDNNGKITGLDASHNTALEELACNWNQLTTLDVSQNTALKTLACNWNQLTSLDVRQCTGLQNLNCGDNSLTSLDVSQNTALKELICYNNQLTSLDVRQCTGLQNLNCGDNSLTSLDVSQNTALKELYCYNNRLTSLDVSQCTGLQKLDFGNNSLTSLDVSQNTALKMLRCYKNKFSTQALDDIYCSLPQRVSADNAVISPLALNTDAGYSNVMATNKQNAIAKNWEVLYYANYTDIPATTGTYTCPPSANMNRYIELTVKPGSTIKLDLMAEAENTLVKIISGTQSSVVSVGTSWTGWHNYTAQGTKMKIYGDVKQFDCRGNTTKITGLDASHNTMLTYLHCGDNSLTSLNIRNPNSALTNLYCYRNKFTSQALDDIYCALPQRVPADSAVISPLALNTDAGYSNVMATNKQNAIDKGWAVKSALGDIPATTGTYTCGNFYCSSVNNLTATVNADNTVTLNWTNPPQSEWPQGCNGDLDFYFYDGTTSLNYDCTNNLTSWTTPVLSAGTHTLGVKIDYYDASSRSICESDKAIVSVTVKPFAPVNMNRYIKLTVKTGEQIELNIAADAKNTSVMVESGTFNTTISVGTDWIGLKKYYAGTNTMTIYGDVKKIKSLYNMYVLTELDASHNTALEYIECPYNSINYLDVSQNTALKYLDCQGNLIPSLDVRNNKALEYLNCSDNLLHSLDVSQNTALETLLCAYNSLYSLDISQNTALKELICDANNLSTQALDDIYCALPQRETTDNAVIRPITNSSDAAYSTVMATNKQNAIDKNWKVQYSDNWTNIPATTGTYVCPPPLNMNRWIELTVVPGSTISFDFKADANNTPVLVVDGTGSSTWDADTDWKSFPLYTVDSGTLRLYGDITGFNCGAQKNIITAIDVSHNTALKILNCGGNSLTSLDISQNKELRVLSCYNNNFTAQAIDDIYCALPVRKTADNARIYPVHNAYSTDLDVVMTTNKQNAINKGWKVQYSYDNTDIPATTGAYVCPVKCIVVAVQQGKGGIELEIETAEGAYSKVVCGTLNTEFTGYFSDVVTPSSNSLTIYGDVISVYMNPTEEPDVITAINTSNNTSLKNLSISGTSISSIDVSKNINLEYLGMFSNSLTSLDISALSAIETLNCDNNNLTSLNLSKNTALKYLNCCENNFSSSGLNVSNNAALITLSCSECQLSTLDISNNPLLEKLDCNKNNLTALDVSNNTALKKLECYGNNFTAQSLDDIYCSLPVRAVADNAVMYPLYNTSDANNALLLTSNKKNAVDKAWSVQYYYNKMSLPTTGTYICVTTIPATVTTSDATAITQTTATLNGTVNPGTDVIGEKGFEWKKTTGGTYADLVSTSGGKSFSANLTGLVAGTSYTFRAYVKVGNNKVYGAEKTFTTSIGTGIDNITQTVSIYPNPTKDILNIKSDKAIEGVELYDALGRMVLSESGAPATEKSVNVSSLTRGIYILQLRTASGITKYKVTVSK